MCAGVPMVFEASTPAFVSLEEVDQMSQNQPQPAPKCQRCAQLEAELQALRSAKAGKPCEPYFKVLSLTGHDFCTLAGRFGADPADPRNKVLVKNLKPAQIAQLKGVSPRFLAVTLVDHE